MAEIFALLLWNLSWWLLLSCLRFSQFFTIFCQVVLENCDSSFLELSKIRGPYRGFLSVVFNSSRKMALRALYVVIYPQFLWTFLIKRLSVPSFGRYCKQLIGSPWWHFFGKVNGLFPAWLIFSCCHCKTRKSTQFEVKPKCHLCNVEGAWADLCQSYYWSLCLDSFNC